jgi:hypothetical protein
MKRIPERAIAIAILACVTTGCGLIDSDITRFDLRVSDKEFSVNSADWQLTSDATFPAIDCTDMAGICSSGISEACGNEAVCFGSCDGTNCKALVLVSAAQPINLAQERPELNEVAKQPLINVTVERVFYDITENTLNVPTPELKVYVAPITVTNPGDPQAKLVGTIQPVAAGDTPQGRDLVLTPDGDVDLQEFMGDWQTEFNVLVGSEITIEAGDPVPMGALTASVTVDAYADI